VKITVSDRGQRLKALVPEDVSEARDHGIPKPLDVGSDQI